jgi:hypothetical protein
MIWEEVKMAYPSSWLVIEAIDAKTDGENRIVQQLAVLDFFNEETSKNALLKYLQLHKTYPERELYVVHSTRPLLDIKEQRWVGLGVRAEQ